MTHTTTDAAEARALKACPFCGKQAHVGPTEWGSFYAGCNTENCPAEQGAYDFVTAKSASDHWNNRATAEAASGAGERDTAKLRAVLEKWDADFPLSYDERQAFITDILASLPPATDPAISGLSSFPPNWKLRQMHFSAPCSDDRKWHVNVYGGREGGDTFVGRGTSADEALRDAARNARAALAAAPTIPATGEAMAVADAAMVDGETVIGWLKAEQARLDAEGGDYLMDTTDCINVVRERSASLAATIPATGHAATEGEGA